MKKLMTLVALPTILFSGIAFSQSEPPIGINPPDELPRRPIKPGPPIGIDPIEPEPPIGINPPRRPIKPGPPIGIDPPKRPIERPQNPIIRA